jgi:hypothetical protein
MFLENIKKEDILVTTYAEVKKITPIIEGSLKCYCVTLHTHEDLASFYEDMETPGGDLYIPNREVKVSIRLPSSRNTEYMLTPQEAKLIQNDSRVKAVTLITNQKVEPFYSVTSDWDKGFTPNANDVNWGLLRCTKGQQIAGWGDDATATATGETVTLTSLGEHVDIVIVDTGTVNKNHPIFSDGAGGTRVQEIDWFAYTEEALGQTPTDSSPYPYPTEFPQSTGVNHPTHVAGIAASWAKKAKIYTLDVNQVITGISPTTGMYSHFAKYVKLFHERKEINPITGRKNPTIMNCSFGAYETFVYIDRNTGESYFGSVESVTYRGVEYFPSGSQFTKAELEGFGIVEFGKNSKKQIQSSEDLGLPILMKYRDDWEADITDLMDSGVIVVAASGNSNYKMDISGGDDYNNYVSGYNDYYQSGPFYYHRGTLAAIPGVICVSTVGNKQNDERPNGVNVGPRNDIFAPGIAISSSVNNASTDDGLSFSKTFTIPA